MLAPMTMQPTKSVLTVTALITQCGEPNAFYNPDRGEAVLCYEMLGALMQAAPQ